MVGDGDGDACPPCPAAGSDGEAEADGDERLAKEGVREGLPLLMLLPPPTIDATSSPARKPAS